MPLTLNAARIVVVVPAVNCSVRAFVTSEKFRVLKVLEPVITSVPVEPATVYVKVPKVKPPPPKVFVLAEPPAITMVAEAPENVRPPVAVVFQTFVVPAAVNVQVPVPIVIPRTLTPELLLTALHVRLKLFASIVPWLTVRIPLVMNASWRVYVQIGRAHV